MKMSLLGLFLAIVVQLPNAALAKGSNEIGANLSYFDRATQVDGEKIHVSEFNLGLLYLRQVKTFWTGGEMSYGSSRATNTNSGRLILGVPFKYWIKGPESKGIGIYAIATPYFGREDDGEGGNTVLGFSMGPGIVFFFSDMLGLDTKLYYDYRRIGSEPATTTGLTIGFSVYF